MSMNILQITVQCDNQCNSVLGNTPIYEEKIADSTVEDDMELPLFDLETVVAATNNFSGENKLGEGGFGPVYKVKICY